MCWRLLHTEIEFCLPAEKMSLPDESLVGLLALGVASLWSRREPIVSD